MEKENLVVPGTPEETTQPPAAENPDATAENAVPERRCEKCQALLDAVQGFCPECGAAQKRLCTNCHAELKEGEAFCTACGTPAPPAPVVPLAVSPDIQQYNAGITIGKKKKTALVLILAGVAILLAVVLYFVFGVLRNPDRYLVKGDYEKAYELTKGKERETIVEENMVATVSAICVDSLKDPDSFELRDAWVDEDKTAITLKVAGNNSYGNQVINYWYFLYDQDDEVFNMIDSISDFEETTVYSWDDASERAEKAIENVCKSLVADMIEKDSLKIDDDSVDRINDLFEEDILDDVELLDAGRPEED